MKKYTLFLFVLTFILGFLGLFTNVNSASANVSGCMVGDNFSRTTGQVCNATATPAECRSGDLFSSLTGKPCPVVSGNGDGGSQDNPSDSVTEFNKLFKSSFRIGSRGDDVKALQQFLKDEDYYFGKIDGKYGRITARAVKDFQEDNDITNTITPTPLPQPIPPIIDQSPIISGVSGPQTLNINQTGTWVVKASSPNGGNLSYSVIWGDEDHEMGSSLKPSSPAQTQQTATFTHSYSQAGTYTPTFTVTSRIPLFCETSPCPNTRSAKTSLSVMVGDTITPISTKVSNVLPSGSIFTQGEGANIQLSWSVASSPAGAAIYLDLLSSDGSESLGRITNNPDCSKGGDTVALAISVKNYKWDGLYVCSNWQAHSVNPGSYKLGVSIYSENGITVIATGQSKLPFSIVSGATSPAPSISLITPLSASEKETVIINGNGFKSGAAVLFNPPEGSSVKASSVSFNGTKLTFVIPVAFTLGTYRVAISNLDGTPNSNEVSFTVGSSVSLFKPDIFVLEDDGSLASNVVAASDSFLTKKFYEKYPNKDNYDFLFFHFKEGVLNAIPHAFRTKFLTKGAFMPYTDVDHSSDFGSEKLLGGFINTFNFNDEFINKKIFGLPHLVLDNLYFDLLMHELTHYWNVGLPDELRDAHPDGGVSDRAHYESYTGTWTSESHNVRQKLIKESGGNYFKMNCFSEPKHHDFELYSMGLKSAEEVKEKLIILSKDNIPMFYERCNEPVLFPYVKKAYNIYDFINVLGIRAPSSKEAQKNFRVANVFIVPQGKITTQKEIAALNWISEKFPIVWYKSTERRSMINDIKPTGEISPIISNVVVSTTNNSIKASWITNKPTTTFIVYTAKSAPMMNSYMRTIGDIMKNPPDFTTAHNIEVITTSTMPIYSNTEYNVYLISTDENYNLASYNAGIFKTK